jgi:adenylate cyclase
MQSAAELHDLLQWKSRSIAIMREIDRIRDNVEDEQELAAASLGRLVEAAGTDYGLLFQKDEESGQLQLRASIDRAQAGTDPVTARARELALRAAALASGKSIDAESGQPDGTVMYYLALSLRVAGSGLGSIVLVNKGKPFSPEAKELIDNAVSQIDSAMNLGRILLELRREKKELETIFRIDRIRDTHESLQDMLDAILPEICRTIDAQTGFIMLFDQTGRELELRAATQQDILADGNAQSPIHLVTREAIETAQLIHRSYDGGPIRSILAQPLILRDKLIGVLGVVNRRGRDSFTRMDIHLIRAIASQIDTAIFEGLQTQRLRNAFGQCVGPEVMKRLLAAGDTDLLTGDRIPITTLFSDIRGFTNMSELIEPELGQVILNDHLSTMTELVLSHEGTLDKYIGDSVMCFFNAPERQQDHALRAVRLALEMQAAHREVIERWLGRWNVPPIGIGVSTGDTIVGNFGSVKRLEYTVLGSDVNLAARLCGAAGGGQILISRKTYQDVKDWVKADELVPVHLKGFEADQRCWSVSGLA